MPSSQVDVLRYQPIARRPSAILGGDPLRVTMERCRKETVMGKRGRKKRARKKNAANHGKRPNA
ncbi:MAG: hypothetical protein DI630_24110 [Gordonia sp. (in: high G+C Gram-positive bacteria)]|nr:MAG: hypothetical protein DI630_24110 [Gordonia sp. (in: high G+C Gram-positive bacteria)]